MVQYFCSIVRIATSMPLPSCISRQTRSVNQGLDRLLPHVLTSCLRPTFCMKAAPFSMASCRVPRCFLQATPAVLRRGRVCGSGSGSKHCNLDTVPGHHFLWPGDRVLPPRNPVESGGHWPPKNPIIALGIRTSPLRRLSLTVLNTRGVHIKCMDQNSPAGK